VFYMAVAQLAAIVARLLAAGAHTSHPVALIEQATLPGQRVLRAQLGTITALAGERAVAPPALLVTGASAAFGASEALSQVLSAAPPERVPA
jgi:siroheme synthase